MRKLLLLFFALLTGVGGAWATNVNWSVGTGTQDNYDVWGFGITLPAGCESGKAYSFESLDITLRGSASTLSLYMAICTESGYSTGNYAGLPFSASKVIAVSNDKPAANASSFTYHFSSPVTLFQGVTYYVLFFQDNVPSEGNYSRNKMGIKVAKESYTPTLIKTSNAETETNWAPVFSATLKEECTWTSLNSVEVSYAAVNAIKLTTPSDNEHYKLSLFDLYLSNSGEYSTLETARYLVISEYPTPDSSIPQYKVLGISKNNPTATAHNTAKTFLFDNVYLKGNKTYYIYFATSNTLTNGVYALSTERIALSKNVTASYFSGAWMAWEPRYNAALTVFDSAPAVSNPMPASTIDSPIWHTLKVSSYYIAYDRGQVRMEKTDVNGEYPDNYLWAFIGNETTGYDIYNKGAGKYLVKGNEAYDSNNNHYYLAMSETPSTKWGILYESSNFHLRDITDGSKWVNRVSNRPITFTSALGAAEAIQPNLNTQITNYIQPFLDNAGDGYFKIPSSSVSTFNTAITTCRGDDNFVSASEYLELLSYFNGVITRPTTGYYFMKSNDDTYMNRTSSAASSTETTTDLNAVVKLERVGDRTYKIALQGQYIAQPVTSTPITFDDEGATFMATTEAANYGKVAFTTDSWYGALHRAATQSNKIVGWEYNEDASIWTVEDAESVDISLTTVGEKSYATVYLPFPVSAISGAKAYKLSVSGETATAHEITEFPAGTGVLLISDENNATATLTIGGTPADINDNKLSGHYLAGTVSDAYVLANGESGIGFYLLNDDQSVAANKAYILASDLSVKAITINFDDVDAIQSIENGHMKIGNAIYNIAGQRVTKAQKGIFIVNGKKVVK